MPDGFTYFCRDQHGNTYSRYSESHGSPRYVAACVVRNKGSTGPVAKTNITYSSRVDLAWARHHRFQSMRTRHAYNLEAEVVRVRAYPGRCEIEYPMLHHFREDH